MRTEEQKDRQWQEDFTQELTKFEDEDFLARVETKMGKFDLKQ